MTRYLMAPHTHPPAWMSGIVSPDYHSHGSSQRNDSTPCATRDRSLEALPRREAALSVSVPTLSHIVEDASKLKRAPSAHPNPGQTPHKNGGGHAHSG